MKADGKMMRRAGDMGSPNKHIVCMNCGKLLSMSARADSIVRCTRCGANVYFYLDNQVLVQYPAWMLNGEGVQDNMKQAAAALRRISSAQMRQESDLQDAPI